MAPPEGDGGDLASLPYPEAGELTGGGPALVGLLPVGSTEPHGPHLPLATDVIISVEAARRGAARLRRAGYRALVLPALPYAITEFSRDFPGAVSVTRRTFESLVEEICRALLAQGFAAVCLVNSHLEPDHIAALSEAADRAARATGRPVIFPDITRRRWASLLTEEFRSGACHAGQFETSLVLAARPDLVREPERAGLPANPISIGRKIKEGARTFREAGGDRAYFGDPAAATAEEGERSFEALAEMIETAVAETMGGR